MNNVAISLLVFAGLTAPVAAFSSTTLLQSRNCMACHDPDRKVVGPSWRDIKNRYGAGDVDMLVQSIRFGSKKWSPVPAPASPHVTDSEARTMAQYILGVPNTPAPSTQADSSQSGSGGNIATGSAASQQQQKVGIDRGPSRDYGGRDTSSTPQEQGSRSTVNPAPSMSTSRSNGANSSVLSCYSEREQRFMSIHQRIHQLRYPKDSWNPDTTTKQKVESASRGGNLREIPNLIRGTRQNVQYAEDSYRRFSQNPVNAGRPGLEADRHEIELWKVRLEILECVQSALSGSSSPSSFGQSNNPAPPSASSSYGQNSNSTPASELGIGTSTNRDRGLGNSKLPNDSSQCLSFESTVDRSTKWTQENSCRNMKLVNKCGYRVIVSYATHSFKNSSGGKGLGEIPGNGSTSISSCNADGRAVWAACRAPGGEAGVNTMMCSGLSNEPFEVLYRESLSNRRR